MKEGSNMIELSNVSIETRHPILKDVNYTFQNNKIYGIVAENGSGKTTLFRVLVNLKKAKKGTVLYDHLSAEKTMNDIFYFENVEWLDKNLSGLDYMRFTKKMWKSNLDIEEIIKEWSMEEYIKLPIRKYSLGMKQRLVIGMYLVSDAKYLIMDEITNGLDEANRKRFFKTINELREKGKTLLLSSHYKDEIVEHCDIVLQIREFALKEVES